QASVGDGEQVDSPAPAPDANARGGHGSDRPPAEWTGQVGALRRRPGKSGRMLGRPPALLREGGSAPSQSPRRVASRRRGGGRDGVRRPSRKASKYSRRPRGNSGSGGGGPVRPL